MPLTRLTCPICLAELKPKTPAPEGSRVRCPKCKGAFVAEGAPAEEPEPEPVQEPMPLAADRPPEEDVLDAVEVVEEPPARRRNRGRDQDDEAEEPARRKPIQKGRIPVWLWLATGGAGMFLLCGCCGVPAALFATGGLSWNAGGSGLPVLSGSSRVTLANYNQIRKGTSEAQVKAILGEPTNVAEIALMHVDTWKSGDDFITVSFKDDKALVGKCHIVNGAATVEMQGALP